MEIDELNAEIEKMEKSIANAKKKVESCEKKRKSFCKRSIITSICGFQNYKFVM